MKSRRRSMPREVFLSHASQDRAFVDWLRDELVSRGVSVWYSETHIGGAQLWHDEIGRALARCDWFVLVLSPASVQSVWVHRELLYALTNSRYIGRIVPLVLAECDCEKLSWTLSSMQHIKFASRQDGLKELLRVWGLKE